MAKIMVSLPEELLHEIDAVAQARSMSRSALLAAAARREIARPDPAALDDAIARSEQRFQASGRFEAADLVRRDRGSRR
jgi:metal-responsive CopG/Arc/MetJ family transcriptional regulator